jgi:hypothetical protein
MNKISSFFLSLFVSFSFFGRAQDFEVSPVIMNFNAEPGTNQTIKLTITNHSSKKSDFTLTIEDFEINNKGEKVYRKANSTKHAIEPMLSFSQSTFSINPNSKQEISVIVQVPSNESGTKWGVLYIKPTKEQTAFSADKAMKAALSLSAQIAVHLYQSPKSNKNYKGKISNFVDMTTPKDTVYRFNADILNIGDKVLDCKIYIMAADLATAEEKQFPSINFTSFPETNCTIELRMPKSLPKGTYVLAAILDYGNNSTLEGAQLLLEVK